MTFRLVHRPRVSVILPAYNAAKYLRAAVDSILRQTFTDFELVALDDGSTDRTLAILQKFAAADRRVRVISRPNTGFLPALLEAVGEGRGDYLARMDADDIAHPQRLAKQVAFLDENPEVAVVGSSYTLIDGRGRPLRDQDQPTDDATLQQHCLAGTTPICHPTATFRRTAYDAVGGYDPAAFPAEDLDLWLRLGEVGRLACLPELLLQYRLHAGSISESKQSQQIEAQRRVCMTAAWRRGVPAAFAGDAGWREEAGREGRLKQTLKYGWWAFNSGRRKTALAYAAEAVRQKPISRAAWTLFGCGVLKPSPAGPAFGPLAAWPLTSWFGRAA